MYVKLIMYFLVWMIGMEFHACKDERTALIFMQIKREWLLV